MRVALLGIDQWESLTPEQQQRFRELASRATSTGVHPLDREEQKELRRLWKALEPKRLLRDALRLAGTKR